MTKQELVKGLMPYVLRAFVSPENIHTGFLTRQRVNPLTPKQIRAFSLETENIINRMVQLCMQKHFLKRFHQTITVVYCFNMCLTKPQRHCSNS